MVSIKKSGIYEILLIIVGIFLITMTSIGIDCINRDGQYYDNKIRESNKLFLIVMLIVAIVIVIGAYGIVGIRIIKL